MLAVIIMRVDRFLFGKKFANYIPKWKWLLPSAVSYSSKERWMQIVAEVECCREGSSTRSETRGEALDGL